MTLKKALLFGIPAAALVLAGALSVAQAGGAACSAKSASTQTAACASKDASVQTASTSCGTTGAAVQTASSCGSTGASATAACSGSSTAMAGNCMFKSAAFITASSSSADGCCASKGASSASLSSCSSTTGAAMQASAGSCSSKGAATQTASAGSCSSKGAATQTASAGSCSSKGAATQTASSGACSTSGAKDTNTAGFVMPKNVSYTRTSVPGGVDFVFAGEGVAEFAQTCGTKSLKTCGNSVSITNGGQFLVISIRGEKASDCCGSNLEALLSGAMADASPATATNKG